MCCDQVISSNDGKRLRSDLAIFPFNHDIVLGTFVGGVSGHKGTFMSNDVLEFPQFGPIIILLLNVVEDLIVRENFLILVIID